MGQAFRPKGVIHFATCAICIGCHAQSDENPAFPAPSVSAMLSGPCVPLAAGTVVADLGSLYPGGGDSSAQITIDDEAIYLTASPPGAPVPTLYRVPKNGGPPLALDPGAVGPVAIDGPALLYGRVTSHPQSGGVAYDYPSVIRLSDDGSLEVLPGVNGAGDILGGPVVDATGAAYWLTTFGGSSTEGIVRWDPGSNQSAQIPSSIASPVTSFVGDGASLYWSSWSGSSSAGGGTQIVAMLASGGEPRVLATRSDTAFIADEDDDALYLVPDPFAATPVGGIAVERISKADGSTAAVVAIDVASYARPPSGALLLFAHDENVYWPSVGASGGTLQISRAPKLGGSPEVVLDSGNAAMNVLGMGFDACNVYVAVGVTVGAESTYSILGAGLPAAGAPDGGSSATSDASGSL